jgi:hypothetical protein
MYFRNLLFRKNKLASRNRRISNTWLRKNCEDVMGKVISIGSVDDSDQENSFYKEYFPNASEYLITDVTKGDALHMVLDVCDMSQIIDESVGCFFCSGVLEHVKNPFAAIDEMHRCLSQDGTLLLGLPFFQDIHLAPQDYWRFTPHGVDQLLADKFKVTQSFLIKDNKGKITTIWTKAKK